MAAGLCWMCDTAAAGGVTPIAMPYCSRAARNLGYALFLVKRALLDIHFGLFFSPDRFELSDEDLVPSFGIEPLLQRVDALGHGRRGFGFAGQ